MAQQLSPDAQSVQQAFSTPAWYQALTLSERLEALAQWGAHEEPDQPELAARRLHKWKQQAPFEQTSYFAERLAQDGITEEDLRYLLGEAPAALQARIADPPAWLTTLERILSTSDSTIDLEFLDTTQSQKATLFLNVLKPLLRYGIERLQRGVAQLVARYQSLPFESDSAAQFFLPDLLDTLLRTILKTFTMELNIARLQGTLSGETSEERFTDFVRHLSDPAALRAFFERYPILARELLTIIDHWAAYGLEFFSHLCADWPEICAQLAQGNTPGLLQEARMGAGDAHRQGRSVIRLTFSSGFKLIYKPRSLSIDNHFYALLRWLNEQGAQPTFRALRVIERAEYGWVEFVEPQTCDSPEEIARFYERLGSYLAILYALGANDFHHENLIACGEHPMLIDLESLIAPALPLQPPVQSHGNMLFQSSVMRIGLLPTRIWGNDDAEGIDISGLGGKGGQLSPHHSSIPDEVGTDQMRIVRQRFHVQGTKNQPTLHDEAIEFLDYQDQLLSGFTRVYRLLLDQRETFLREILPLFERDTIRVIPRATRTYGMVLQESQHPTLLHNALLRDRFFDQIWQPVPKMPFLARIIPAELADLHENDIPFFTSRPGTRDLYTSRGECLENFFPEPALTSIAQRIQQLDEPDLARQTWLIRASFATVSMNDKPAQARTANRFGQSTTQPVERERLLQAACAVGDRLCELALVGQDEASWFGLHLLKEREWKVLVGGIDLYNGQAGITLFLAYLGMVTHTAKYTDMARLALRGIQQQIAALPEQGPLPGAFHGWGALIYLYAHLGAIWHDAELLKEAEKLLEPFAEAEIKDDTLNILSGSAGTILSLLNLHSVAPSARTLHTAVKCGEHLLARAVPLTQGRGWLDARLGKPLTGFSHGASGIALSLFALAAASGEERFQQAALDALAYERSTFSQQEQNWPDLRGDEEHFMTGWCHGAPGIGLARLAALPYHDDAATREEIALALQTTLAGGFGRNHSLCHGDLGNLDVVLTASQMLNDPHYHAEVARLSALILEDIEQTGWRTGVPRQVETPGLLVGIAGIGYELLRLAEPALVPSVLSLASPIVSLKEE